jgi:hypothetical protein
LQGFGCGTVIALLGDQMNERQMREGSDPMSTHTLECDIREAGGSSAEQVGTIATKSRAVLRETNAVNDSTMTERR